MNDGGFYALKGFAYQIDKAILEILLSENENKEIYVENIQDIDSESWVMQVKYKEKTKLVPSVLREPVKQLIQEYQNANNKEFYLYTYFADMNGYDDYFTDFNLDKLNRILGKDLNTYSKDLLVRFINKFKLISSPEFHIQYKSVIDLLQKPEMRFDKNETLFVYSMIVDFILRKITHSEAYETSSRRTTKRELLKYINGGRNLIFNKIFKDNFDIKKYISHLKKSTLKMNKRKQNFIFIGNINDDTLSISDMISEVVENYFSKATYTIKPPTFIISNQLDMNKIKDELLKLDLEYNDGYELIDFNKELFQKSPMIYRRTKANGKVTTYLSKISYKLRIITETSFECLDIDDYLHFRRIYFDWNKEEPKFDNTEVIVEGLNSMQVKEVLS